MDVTTAAFWAAVGSIILANVVLSGDNAVVIAMAARALPVHLKVCALAASIRAASVGECIPAAA